GFNANHNFVQGNLIGTNAAGDGAIANDQKGVRVVDGDDNTIGGTEGGAGNVISGNKGVGVNIVADAGAPIANIVQGNLIGTTADGISALGNAGDGISLVQATRT